MATIGGRPEQAMLRGIISTMGKRSGRLVALSPAGKQARAIMWVCRCDCGQTVIVKSSSINSGSTLSCGCLRREATRAAIVTHGMYRSREYRTWKHMIQRCTNPNKPEWPKYGGRGIAVCERWLTSFENFYADMGPRPHEFSLDRENNNGNYEPPNCRWADLSTQARNSRKVPSVNRSRFKGVYFCNGAWQAQIRHLSRGIYIGSFPSEELAAKAYDQKAVELRGSSAVTNQSMGLLSCV